LVNFEKYETRIIDSALSDHTGQLITLEVNENNNKITITSRFINETKLDKIKEKLINENKLENIQHEDNNIKYKIFQETLYV
jgi:hypothetical protein